MATKMLIRPGDPIPLAKLIGDIVTGLFADAAEERRDDGRGGADDRTIEIRPSAHSN